MAKKKPFPATNEPRTKRTRAHVIADLSVNYVERIIVEKGHVTDRDRTDYGYDLTMTTFDEDGYSEPGLVYFQLKAADTIERYERQKDDCFVFSVSMQHYHLWRNEYCRFSLCFMMRSNAAPTGFICRVVLLVTTEKADGQIAHPPNPEEKRCGKTYNTDYAANQKSCS